ncbi:MAG: DUF502 domain-containing protein [Halobacteriales archaeon]
MSIPRPIPPSEADVSHLVRESFLTGIAVVVPGLLTLYLLTLVVQFFVSMATPVAEFVLLLWPGVTASYVVIDLGIATLLVAGTFAIGFVAHFHAGERAIRYVDGALTRVPGVGTVYESFRRMGDAMVASDRRSFREVKLVRLPTQDTYALGFLIAESPPEIDAAVDGDLRTVFVPLAPNPVMAGFLVHVPDDDVVDVDLSVEEGISAIVSLGAAEADPTEGMAARFAGGEPSA